MTHFEENWNYQLDLVSTEHNDFNNEFEVKLKCLHQHVLLMLKDGFKNQMRNVDKSIGKSNDDELKSLIEQNKHLRDDIESKLVKISNQKSVYESNKKDQKLLSQEIKETHEAYLMAKKHYKKFLKIYYTIESRNGDKQTIFVQFFTENKKESENYSIRLQRNSKTGIYDLLSTTPKLQELKDLQKQLQETSDLPGALVCIRQRFLSVKKSKK